MAKKRTITKDRLSLEELVDLLIAKGIEALENHKLKVTVADLIRFRELQKELAPEPPVTVEATWIDGWN